MDGFAGISHKMGIFAMPVSFANSAQPLQLLQACVDRCIETIDASVFDGEVVSALEKYVWSKSVVRVAGWTFCLFVCSRHFNHY